MAALGPFEAAPTLAVAVSGGADSLALVLLADGWARGRGGRVLALVVDHGLRPGAAAEAARVAGWLADRGIACERLAWVGAKPATGVQAAAREARHALLAAACRRRAILHLLLGHQRDDQAETVAMRHERGSGPRGLAAMAAVREVAGLRLLRPLLGVPRERLRAALDELGQPWIDDPSNADPAFRRGRLRLEAGLAVDALAEEALRAGRARAAFERRLALFLACAARPHPAGFVVLDRAALLGAEADLAGAAMARCLACVGGAAYPPRQARLARLMRRLEAGAVATSTLGGCLVVVDEARLLVLREPALAVEEVLVAPHDAALWDGRFVIANRGPSAVRVRALGAEGWRRQGAAGRARLRGLPHPARLALPALLGDAAGGSVETPCALHHVAGGPAAPPGAVQAQFRPRSPLSEAAYGLNEVVSAHV